MSTSVTAEQIACTHVLWDGGGNDELIVDFFAGGGGTSTGCEMALGRSPDIAANHDAEAVAMHKANHPDTVHLTQDVWTAWRALDLLIGNRPVGAFWASPDCKHFSKAKGGRPVKRKIRDLAWVVPRFAKRFRPRVIMLENVEEFRDWGPLIQKADATGAPLVDLHGNPVMIPCRARKGQTFHQWVAALQRLGYRVEWRERRACNAGAPTIRKRLFIIARRDGRPIVWPAATHGDPKSDAVKSGALVPWRRAADIIDWSLTCPSIFDTAAEIMRAHGLRAQRPLADATMARIAKGVFRYVIDAAEPFIVPITHTGDVRVNSIAEPLRTQTAAPRGEHALVTPFMVRTAHGEVDRNGHHRGRGDLPVTDPAPTVLGSNDAAVITPFLAPRYQEKEGQEPRTRSIELPAATQMPRGNEGVLVTPFMVPRYGERPGQDPRTRSVEDPLPTPVPDGNEATLIAPVLVKNNFGDKPHYGAGDPTHTVCTGNNHLLVAAEMKSVGWAKREARAHAHTAGGLRREGAPNPPYDSVPTWEDWYAKAKHVGGTREEYNRLYVYGPDFFDPVTEKAARIAAFLAQHNTERGGAVKAGRDAREPLGALTSIGNQQNVVAAFLAQHNTDMVGHDAGEPVSTIVGKGCTQGVVACSLQTAAEQPFGELAASAGIVNLKGSERRGASIEDPTPTSTAQGRHIAEVRAFLMKYHRDGGQHADLAEPAPTDGCRATLGLVTVHGVDYQIVDIGMRMLTPRERFLAQGFPPGFKIDVMVEKTVRGRTVTKPISLEAQGRMCGNSVSPPEACALFAANCADMAAGQRKAAS